jgi:hypothetical protein
VQVLVVQTPFGNVQIANSAVVSGRAFDAILGTFDRGNSPLAQAFRSSIDGGSGTPVSQAFQAALENQQVRDFLQANGSFRYFDGSSWQSFDPSSLNLGGQTASAATGGEGTFETDIAAFFGSETLDDDAAHVADRLFAESVLGAGRSGGLEGGLLGDAEGAGVALDGTGGAHGAAESPVGAQSFGRQLAAAAFGFEREAARLASALAKHAG